MTIDELNFPKFQNRAGSNHCWFNSVLQVIIHALKDKQQEIEMVDFEQEIEMVDIDNDIGTALYKAIKMFNNPGLYDVENKIKDPSDQNTEIPLKELMLKQMNISSQELYDQHDAQECIQAILGAVPHLSFLLHQTQDLIKCTGSGCEYSTNSVEVIPVSSIDIFTTTKKRGRREKKMKFNFLNDKKRYFQKEEQVIRNCESCNASVSLKQIKLSSSTTYIIIHFKRFYVTSGKSYKYSDETEPFSFVEIDTLEGIKRYEVIATIEHEGSNMIRGHYISYIKQNDTWFCCDDTKITELGKNIEAPTKNCYVVLLKKVVE